MASASVKKTNSIVHSAESKTSRSRNASPPVESQELLPVQNDEYLPVSPSANNIEEKLLIENNSYQIEKDVTSINTSGGNTPSAAAVPSTAQPKAPGSAQKPAARKSSSSAKDNNTGVNVKKKAKAPSASIIPTTHGEISVEEDSRVKRKKKTVSSQNLNVSRKSQDVDSSAIPNKSSNESAIERAPARERSRRSGTSTDQLAHVQGSEPNVDPETQSAADHVPSTDAPLAAVPESRKRPRTKKHTDEPLKTSRKSDAQSQPDQNIKPDNDKMDDGATVERGSSGESLSGAPKKMPRLSNPPENPRAKHNIRNKMGQFISCKQSTVSSAVNSSMQSDAENLSNEERVAQSFSLPSTSVSVSKDNEVAFSLPAIQQSSSPMVAVPATASQHGPVGEPELPSAEDVSPSIDAKSPPAVISIANEVKKWPPLEVQFPGECSLFKTANLAGAVEFTRQWTPQETRAEMEMTLSCLEKKLLSLDKRIISGETAALRSKRGSSIMQYFQPPAGQDESKPEPVVHPVVKQFLELLSTQSSSDLKTPQFVPASSSSIGTILDSSLVMKRLRSLTPQCGGPTSDSSAGLSTTGISVDTTLSNYVFSLTSLSSAVSRRLFMLNNSSPPKNNSGFSNSPGAPDVSVSKSDYTPSKGGSAPKEVVDCKPKNSNSLNEESADKSSSRRPRSSPAGMISTEYKLSHRDSLGEITPPKSLGKHDAICRPATSGALVSLT